jgi:hypothetical protein
MSKRHSHHFRSVPLSYHSVRFQHFAAEYRESGYLRAESIVLDDVNELVELRAQQRTFDGAYSRTALSCLGYALTILRLFDTRFFPSK